MGPALNELQELEKWYGSNGDGDWEHQNGISIGTLDNPGWTVDINLAETRLENVPYTAIRLDRSDTDWLHCEVKGQRFLGFGGVHNLSEIISIFTAWANVQKGP